MLGVRLSPLALRVAVARAVILMGAICSSSSNHTGGHTYVSANEPQNRRQPQQARVLGENSPASGPPGRKPDPRAAAAEAAEARLKAVSV